MNAHVLTTTRSASPTSSVTSHPSAPSAAAILSESTTFFGQPSVTKWKRPATRPAYRRARASAPACASCSAPLACLGPAQCAFHEQDQRLLHMRLAASVTQHHRHVGRDSQCFPHLTRVMRGDADEQVARDDARDAQVFALD